MIRPFPSPWVIWLAILIPTGADIAAKDPGPNAPATTRPAPALRSPDAPFPIGVWLQNPRNARRYQAAGINLYVGLWRGPTEEQLATLREAGMRVVCAQNAVGLAHRDDPLIAGWMHDDEPDNAQSLGPGQGYGPPILPEVIVRDYQRMRAADPSRPVLLNLGQGVAWDDYIGRGVRRRHPEDYPEYVRGADIVSFDIYPVVHESPAIAGRLEYVARGVERLRGWAGENRTVWNCIECTHISNPKAKATPAQVRAEVWMSLIHGSQGLIYFVHQFQPSFREAALLDDPAMLAAVTTLNHRIQALAPVLRQPSESGGFEVRSSAPDAPVATLLKRHRNDRYLFAVNLRPVATRATFHLGESHTLSGTAEVLDEGRSLDVPEGRWSDDFGPYDVHLYHLRPR